MCPTHKVFSEVAFPSSLVLQTIWLSTHKPNLQPPVTTVAAALSYRERLQALAPDVVFLLTLYLHSSITPAHIAEAAAAGIVGVKAYPAGLTTNSEAGVLDYEAYHPVFEATHARA